MKFTICQLATGVAATVSMVLMPYAVSFNTSLALMEIAFVSARADIATSNFHYQPPNRGTPKTTQGTGSRGCDRSEPATMTLLVPNDHIGQTISGRPTFFWHVSDKTSVPVEFALVEPGVAKPLFVHRMQVQKGGIMQVQLPQNAPELVSGRKYRWSVSLLCNSNRPSNNVFVQSWIERVPGKPELTQQLTNGKSEVERARIYAASGLWYDALATISTAYNANPSDRSIAQARLSLLAQVGLDRVVAQEQQNLAFN
jgi:Domain of Unknown Function (DUF928)